MHRETVRRAILWVGGFFGIWLFFKYLLPIGLPFGFGLILALAAEPAVRAGTQLLRLPRWAATGLGVTLTLVLLVTMIGILGAVAVKELRVLAGRLPDLQVTAEETVDRLRLFLERAASHAPQGVRPLVDRSVARLFTSGTALMEQAAVRLPKAISAVLSWVPDGALGVGTGILSGFMLSARLPKLKPAIARRVPEELRTKLLPVLRRSKEALWGWVRAQLKLAVITYGIVTVGFLLLRVPFAPLWAAGVALVDAVPLLGTGTVLLPWALVSLVQREHLRSIGLLCIYGTTFFTRTVLEPKLVGRQLGIDPLVTLIFLYLGYKFWGLFGMLVAPMLAVAITAVGRERQDSPTEVANEAQKKA